MITPPNLSLLLIMACFWLVFWLVYSQFLKPIGALLDQRETQVRSAATVYSSAKDELSEALARCERELAQTAAEGQKVRSALRGEGEAARRAAIEAARQQGQQRLATLAGELDAASADARTALRQKSGDLARALAERLIERRIAS